MSYLQHSYSRARGTLSTYHLRSFIIPYRDVNFFPLTLILGPFSLLVSPFCCLGISNNRNCLFSDQIELMIPCSWMHSPSRVRIVNSLDEQLHTKAVCSAYKPRHHPAHDEHR